MTDSAQTTESDRLQKRLNDMNTVHFHVTLGPEAHTATVEQVAAELNRMLDARDAGDCQEFSFNDKPRDIRDWLKEEGLRRKPPRRQTWIR